MSEGALARCRVLVVEDDFLLASHTASLLERSGATILGPVGNLGAVKAHAQNGGFDIAVLDIRLGDELIYSVADELRLSNVPIVFLTGYDKATIPPHFVTVPICQKPCLDEEFIRVLVKLYALSVSNSAGR